MTIERIRAQFPALERRAGNDSVAYFDGPGGTQAPRVVGEAMLEYFYHHNANTHWNYPTSAETDAMLFEARVALGDFLGGAPEEIAFGANMTTLAFHLSRALGRGWTAGDVVVTTELDHHANIAPWRALERERGIGIRPVRMNPDTGTLDLADLHDAILGGKPPRLVAIGAASNALGTINDVAAICAMARKAGALSFVDAVHYAPHNLVDVAAFGCDFLACSAYKFYGPHIGVLWGKRALIEALDVPRLEPAPDETSERLETGTQNHEGIVGAGAAVDFLAAVAGGTGSRRERLARSFAMLHEQGQRQVTRLWNGLGEIEGVTRFGVPPDQPRTPTVSFVIEGVSPSSAAGRLAEHGIFVSHGDFYALTVIERLGRLPDGVIRAGCACYTSDEEVERLLRAVEAVAQHGAGAPVRALARHA